MSSPLWRGPKKSTVSWPEAQAFAQEVCRRMADDDPARYLLNMAKTSVAAASFSITWQRQDGDGGGASLATGPRRRHGIHAAWYGRRFEQGSTPNDSRSHGA